MDAFGPLAGLISDAQGNLYGTTSAGGDWYKCDHQGCGTVFKLTPSGTETLLYKFNGGSDGAGPKAPLVFDQNGNLYGTTWSGGAFNCGTVFKLPPSGAESVLYSFACTPTGFGPSPGGLILDNQGNLYGVTAFGGIGGCSSFGQSGCGAIFEVSPSGTETVLYSFTGGTEGWYPNGNLVFDTQGNLYGAALYGGITNSNCSLGCGVIFKLAPSGTETLLHAFTGQADGAYPNGFLVFDGQGNLYGTTWVGGAYTYGTVFKLTP